ncbi:hypothetical protein ABK040_007856 [Willaertia magna]
MFPSSPEYPKRKRIHAWEYIESNLPPETKDFTNEKVPVGFEHLKQPNYFFSDFDLSYPSSISYKSFPSDLPDQLFKSINFCKDLLDDTILCQMKKKYDRHCQLEIANFLKCKFQRDIEMKVRILQYENYLLNNKLSHEEINNRKREIENQISDLEVELSKAIKPPYRDFLEEKRIINDLQFLDQRLFYIQKKMDKSI